MPESYVIHLAVNGTRRPSFCEEPGMIVLYYEWRRVGNVEDCITPLPAEVCIACFGMAQRAGVIPQEAKLDEPERFDGSGG